MKKIELEISERRHVESSLSYMSTKEISDDHPIIQFSELEVLGTNEVNPSISTIK